MATDPAASPSRRIEALDALRGVAVAGIIPMNVIAWSMPAAAYINPRAFGGDGPVEAALWAASFVLVEDKFRALFAMMFGAGVTILLERTEGNPLRGHYARMAVLALIALAHAVFLANNDVLRSYAVIGLVLPLLVRLPVRWLFIGAVALVAGQLAVSGFVAWGWLRYWYANASGVAVDPAFWAEAERRFGADPQVIASSLAQAQEGFAERAARRIEDPMLQIRAVAAAVPSTLAAMMVGIALWKNGLLAGQWHAARLLRLFRWCALMSLPALLAMAAWSWWSGYDAIVTTFNALVFSAPFDLVLGVGYAALAMALFGGRWRGSALADRWAKVGRMALTNYLATSLVFALLFASWGLGLYGEVTRRGALAMGLVPIALMLLWSPFWLRYFNQGPAEWLWRSLAAMKLLPLLRR